MNYYIIITTSKGQYHYPIIAIDSEQACSQAKLQHALKDRAPIQTVTV